MTSRPTLAVWKFASCDGCQLSILDCEDELLQLVGAVQIASFTEMTSAVVDGPYDVSLVEGSITTSDDADRILAVRAASRRSATTRASANTRRRSTPTRSTSRPSPRAARSRPT